MDNPVGPHGFLTKIGERIPGVNNGIQKLHERAGQKEALERARRVNPVGAHGKLTKIGELTPGVNNVIQHMHARAGQEEARRRASDRNPLGAQGWLTMAGEQVPGLSDGIRQLHIHKGKHDAAERASAKSMQRLLGKDGAVTLVAEMLPGLNVVAAAIHEMAGHEEEADRALSLLHTWREAGGKDGAFRKLAELFPGTDLVAFALHLKGGSIPQALRSISGTSWVRVQASSLVFVVFLASVDTLRVVNYNIVNVVMKPKSMSLSGALIDVAMNVLEMDRSGNRRRQRREEQLRGTANSAGSGDATCKSGISTLSNRSASRGGKRERVKEQADNMITDAINEAICAVIEQQIYRVPQTIQMILDCSEPALKDLLKGQRLALELLPRGPWPFPTQALVEAIRRGIPQLKACHQSIEPLGPVHDRCPSSPSCKHVPQIAGGVSCLGFAGCCFLGLKTGCLGIVAGAIAGGSHVRRKAAEQAAPWLNRQNHRAWEECIFKPARSAAAFGSAAASSSSSSTAPPPAQPGSGLTVRLDARVSRELSGLLWSYLLDQCYSEHWLQEVVKVLERPLAQWASKHMADSSGCTQLAVAIKVPEQVIELPDTPYLLWLPAFPLLLELDIDLGAAARGRSEFVIGARVSISDSVVDHLLEEVRKQVVAWDLRDADPRFKDFTEPLKVDFKVSLQWHSSEQSTWNSTWRENLNLEVRDFSSTLHLPA